MIVNQREYVNCIDTVASGNPCVLISLSVSRSSCSPPVQLSLLLMKAFHDQRLRLLLSNYSLYIFLQ